MRRRTALALVAAALPAVAGCSADPGDAPAVTPTTEPTSTRTDRSRDPTASGTTDPTAETGTSTEPDESLPLAVELEGVNYVASAYRVSRGRGIDPDDVVPESEIPSALRVALEEARDGAFVTDDPAEDLLAGVDEFRTHYRTSLEPYVRLDGTGHEFDHSLPTFVASLAEETLEEYDPERVVAEDDRDFESEAVESFIHALRASGTHVPRSEYRTCLVPEPVAAFLERYDYVEDYHGVSPIETDRVDAAAPHTIEVRELTDEDMWGRPVVDGDTLDPALRDFFVTAIESDHRAPATASPSRSLYFTDEVPDAYEEFGEEYEEPPYVRLDGTVYGIGVGSPRYDRIPVDVAVEELPRATDGGNGRFELTVTPTADAPEADVASGGTFTFTGRGALPSVLWVEHGDERHLLESDAYVRERWREAPDDPERDRRPANQVLEIRDVGESISATYAVPPELPVGTYVSRGLFSVSWDVPDQIPDDHAAYPFRLRIEIRSP